MATGYYSYEELKNIGVELSGDNIQISNKISLYNAEKIKIGNNVRIDDFVILIGPIEIGNYIHIGAGSILTGGDQGIVVEDFVGISSGCKIFSVSDDYSGDSLTNPTIPKIFKNILCNKIVLGKHSLIGSNSVILPSSGGLAQGVSVGALSLVKRPTTPFGIYFGCPAKRIGNRSQEVLRLEKEFLTMKETGKIIN